MRTLLGYSLIVSGLLVLAAAIFMSGLVEFTAYGQDDLIRQLDISKFEIKSDGTIDVVAEATANPSDDPDREPAIALLKKVLIVNGKAAISCENGLQKFDASSYEVLTCQGTIAKSLMVKGKNYVQYQIKTSTAYSKAFETELEKPPQPPSGSYAAPINVKVTRNSGTNFLIELQAGDYYGNPTIYISSEQNPKTVANYVIPVTWSANSVSITKTVNENTGWSVDVCTGSSCAERIYVPRYEGSPIVLTDSSYGAKTIEIPTDLSNFIKTCDNKISRCTDTVMKCDWKTAYTPTGESPCPDSISENQFYLKYWDSYNTPKTYTSDKIEFMVDNNEPQPPLPGKKVDYLLLAILLMLAIVLLSVGAVALLKKKKGR